MLIDAPASKSMPKSRCTSRRIFRRKARGTTLTALEAMRRILNVKAFHTSGRALQLVYDFDCTPSTKFAELVGTAFRTRRGSGTLDSLIDLQFGATPHRLATNAAAKAFVRSDKYLIPLVVEVRTLRESGQFWDSKS